MTNYLVKPGMTVDLLKWETDGTNAFPGGKDKAHDKLDRLRKRLDELQGLLYAEHKHRVLIVLQGMDTGGKDSTIRFVFEGVNPQGVRVACFKAPTPQELDHDYLWRIHQHMPAKGEIVIFNRSHYEDAVTVRVHKLVDKPVWHRRFRHINEFERMLAEEGTVILKFFLHISREEQKKRLEERLDNPDKRWKFNPADLNERKLWPHYMKAYGETIGLTSTPWAPWYVVPADTKWCRNLVVASAIVGALEDLHMAYPRPSGPSRSVKIV